MVSSLTFTQKYNTCLCAPMYFSIVFFARSYSQYSLQSIITPENCFGGQICGIQPTGNHNLLNYNDACGDIEIYVVAFFV